MAKIILFSSKVLWNSAAGAPYPGIVDAVRAVRAAGSLVWMVSQHVKPSWLEQHFGDSVSFVRDTNRGNGEVFSRVIEGNAPKYRLSISDFIVVGGTDKDLHMAANGRVLLLQPLWVTDRERLMIKYGVPFQKPSDLPHVVELLATKVPWFFEWSDPTGFSSVRVLTNASTMNVANQAIVSLADSLKTYLKTETLLRAGMQLHLLSSIYSTPVLREKDAIDLFAFYPSSGSQNNDTELMAELTHRVREPLGIRIAKRLSPLLIRHRPSTKRHVGGGDRTDPTEQLRTLHLNPEYKSKLRGATVAVLDDFTTYGCSFGVSTALLRAAGAARVVCIAIGKYGKQIRTYDISVSGDPFKPLADTGFQARSSSPMTGTHNEQAQFEFFEKFGRAIS